MTPGDAWLVLGPDHQEGLGGFERVVELAEPLGIEQPRSAEAILDELRRAGVPYFALKNVARWLDENDQSVAAIRQRLAKSGVRFRDEAPEPAPDTKPGDTDDEAEIARLSGQSRGTG